MVVSRGCWEFAIQWNLFITDTLVQDGLSVIKRCPLLGGWFKNASVTHIICHEVLYVHVHVHS